MNLNQHEVEAMMNACADSLDEDLTVDMPADSGSLRTIGLVPTEFTNDEDAEEATVVEAYPLPTIYPPHYEPPIGRAIKRYFKECLERARQLREHDRIQYADTLYYKSRRLLLRALAHMKKNATARPWEEYEKRISL